MQPPKTSVFSPQVQSRYPTASAFRNPAFNSAPPPSFTTPRKPFDEVVMSEASGAESSPATTTGIASPALTDTSEAAPQQHEIDTIRAVSPARRQHQQSGKGAIPRRNHLSLFGRAAGKVRKRARYDDDRDVGSVRHRIESRYRGDETDDDTDAVPGEAAGRQRRSRTSEGGWLRHIFGLIHDHPRLPEILTWWLQFALNAFIMALVVYVCWAFVSSVRADLQLASELERAELAQKIADCGQNYVVNHCASDRAAPALEEQCREWARCMSEDPNKVMKVQNAAKEAVRVINQIGDNVSWRTLVCSTLIPHLLLRALAV